MADEIKRFIGIREVSLISGLSKSTVRRKIMAGAFPTPVISESNLVRWDYAEVMAWRDEQFRNRKERLQNG